MGGRYARRGMMRGCHRHLSPPVNHLGVTPGLRWQLSSELELELELAPSWPCEMHEDARMQLPNLELPGPKALSAVLP